MASSSGGSPPRKSEDYLLERKTKNDLGDLLKTMVAFANTVRPGHTATILIGERDDGTPEGLTNADEIQKRVRKEAEKIYPQIVWKTETYFKDGKECLRVEIEYSGETPHFGGPAWVRKGSESVLATDQEFQRLIDIRSSVVRELDQWVGKAVTLETRIKFANGTTRHRHEQALIRLVNRFYLTLEIGTRQESHPLRDMTVSWDDAPKRLKIILDQVASSEI